MSEFKKIEFPSKEIKNNFASMLKERYRYQVLDDGDDGYLKIKEEFTGKSFYHDVYDINSDINYDSIIRDLPQIPGYEYNYETLDLNKCKDMVSSLLKGFNAENLGKFRNGIFFSKENDLKDLLKYAFEEVFLKIYPKGKIYSIRMDGTYYTKSGLLRGQYTLRNYPDFHNNVGRENFTGFNALRKWLSVETHEYFQTLLNIAEYFFFPYMCSFHVSWKLGLYFIFIPDTPHKYELGKFPQDILSFIRSEVKIADNLKLEEINEIDIFSKHNFTCPTLDEYTDFFEWFLIKSEKFISFNFNLCNFVSEDDADVIDPIFAYEYNLSLLHMLKMSLSILSSNDSYYNKSTTFLIADMLDGICNKVSIGIPRNDSEFFKRLFNRDFAVSKFNEIMTNSPLKIKEYLKSVNEDIYTQIVDTVKDSVWLKYKVSGDNITVRNNTLTGDNVENVVDFTSNVIRALRNTHHGYFTRNDRRGMRPSRYLSMITGVLPSTISSLSLFWVLLLLEDREKFIGNIV